MSLKIAFHSNQISSLGTEVASYGYAHYNETLLGNKSIYLAKSPEIWPYSHPDAIEKFKKRFPLFFYKDISEIEKILDDNNIDIFYAIKSGRKDGIISTKRKTCIHAVFQDYEIHGDKYAYVSKYLGDMFNMPYVPHIVELPDINGDMREELNIPKNVLVFGRYGNNITFDIEFVYNSIKRILEKRKDIYFLFMNTNKFYEHSNIIYLEGTVDLEKKVKFINTSDAFLSARKRGESFGISIAEFSIKNKPIITFGGEQTDKAHLEQLKDNCYLYYNENDLYNIINNFQIIEKDWNMYKEFTPEKVMEKFKKVFID